MGLAKVTQAENAQDSNRPTTDSPSDCVNIVQPSYLVAAADWGPGVYADGGAEFLQAEPGAGLAGADLEGYAFAEHVYWELEILEGWGAQR